jgi:hypothetical protein
MAEQNPILNRPIGRPKSTKSQEQLKLEHAEYMHTYYAAHKEKMKENAMKSHRKQRQNSCCRPRSRNSCKLKTCVPLFFFKNI